MFRSLMTIIRQLFLYLIKVIFMLKHSVRLRRYINYVLWQHVVERHAAVRHTAHVECKTKVIPIIIGASGTISKLFTKYVSNIPEKT